MNARGHAAAPLGRSTQLNSTSRHTVDPKSTQLNFQPHEDVPLGEQTRARRQLNSIHTPLARGRLLRAAAVCVVTHALCRADRCCPDWHTDGALSNMTGAPQTARARRSSPLALSTAACAVRLERACSAFVDSNAATPRRLAAQLNSTQFAAAPCARACGRSQLILDLPRAHVSKRPKDITSLPDPARFQPHP